MTRRLDVVHAHTTAPWKENGTGGPAALHHLGERPVRQKEQPDCQLRAGQHQAVSCAKEPGAEWRSLPEGNLVWDLENNSVPPLDAEFISGSP